MKMTPDRQSLENGVWEIADAASHLPSFSQLISTTIPAPGLTIEGFLQQAIGQERFFWQGAHETTAVAGFGVAADLRAWGDGRFQSIQQQAADLFAGAILAVPAIAAPRLFGGFAFTADFTPDNTWSAFQPAQFILPHYQLAQTESDHWLTINAVIGSEEDPEAILPALLAALQERYALLQQVELEPESAVTIQDINYPMSFAAWRQTIREATAAIKAGPLNKVVLSRVCEIRFNDHAPIDAARRYLNQTYPDCYRFWFEPRPFHAFYGATPERLAQVDGRQLKTMGLAGTTRRGQTPDQDETLARELLNSKKDMYEHEVVVDSLRRRLQPVVTWLSLPEGPEILKLGYIQHLYTPLDGRLKKETGILPILEILHPTPALGGSPRALAMPFIQEAEPVPRGWYAAPVGWIDHRLDGVFAVAIRSAVAQDRRVWLHAGAGIVADSDPQKEWDETQLKFKPMLNALGVSWSGSNHNDRQSLGLDT